MPGIYRHAMRQGIAARAKLHSVSVAIPGIEWTPEDGNVLWWSFPVQELPFIGTPDDDAFPDHATHFTVLVVPQAPR
jgi:hypothetical protein